MPSPLLFIETFIEERLLPPISTESPISRILKISFEQVERSVNLLSVTSTRDINPSQIMQFFEKLPPNNCQQPSVLFDPL